MGLSDFIFTIIEIGPPIEIVGTNVEIARGPSLIPGVRGT